MSWYQYLDIIREAQIEREYWASQPPMSCPLCGEPLRQGPPGAEETLYCPFEGWNYPRDWTRPSY